MAPRRRRTLSLPSSSPPISVGNCEVIVQAKKFTSESNPDGVQISISKTAKITVTVVEKVGECDDLVGRESEKRGDCYFVLANPKDSADKTKSLLKEVLTMYMKELPGMNFAANTGKESMFLKRCVTIGKYCTLVLKSKDDTQSGEIIEDLGGVVASDGRACTHVVTGKVRKTSNFCTALCSGAWVISPGWLKESFKKGRFVDETPFILNDEDYTTKYKMELRRAVLRARARPGALLKGLDVWLATHVQHPIDTLSAIIESAGGNVIRANDKINDVSNTIHVACEEDMEEALAAVRGGIRTFSSEWLINCVITQELDLEAPQFAESL